MAASTTPIFTRVADIQWTASANTANTTQDLTTGTSYLVFTADATNGGYVQKIRFRANGTTTNASVGRVWINNGSTTATQANNVLWDEITLPAITGVQNAATANYELPLNFALPPGYRLYVTLGTAVANGWAISVIGGKY